MTEESESRAVLIPSRLYRQIEERAVNAGFGSLEEYVLFILEEVLEQETKPENTAFSKQDEEEVKKRLKDLGYMQ